MVSASAFSTVHPRVTFLACRSGAREHEIASQRHVAERLATLFGCAFAEARDETGTLRGPLGYAVPNDTLDSLERAHALGIRGEDDLYGGVVPQPFVATKVITHPLVAPDAAAPVGWQPAFAERVRDVGIGLRLGNSRSAVGSVVHIDVAYPIDREASMRKVQINVEAKRSF